MQVGDLQKHLADFDERGVSVVVISVDEPADSLEWAQKKGLTVPLASDPELALIRRFGLENRDEPGLSLHAM